MIVTWDERKRLLNLIVDAQDRFEFVRSVVTVSRAGPDGRPRFKAIGLLDGDVVTLVVSPLGTEAIALISLRRASRNERNAYAAR